MKNEYDLPELTLELVKNEETNDDKMKKIISKIQLILEKIPEKKDKSIS